jgi:hypothetical protein
VDLPFTRAEFLDLFAIYNRLWWPAIVALWMASAVAVLTLLRLPEPPSRLVSGLLVWHWVASGVYHAAFFTRINPAAWLFAALFFTEALLLFWSGVLRTRLRFTSGPSGARMLALILVAYALVYPFIGRLDGAPWPRAPIFAVPCPTTIFTAGALMLAGAPWVLVVIPILWSVIGGSAAFMLGIHADVMLPISGALLAMTAISRYTAIRSRPV